MLKDGQASRRDRDANVFLSYMEVGRSRPRSDELPARPGHLRPVTLHRRAQPDRPGPPGPASSFPPAAAGRLARMIAGSGTCIGFAAARDGVRRTTLTVVVAGVVSAHPGGPEEVIVVGDHVDPGQTFRLSAAFIEATDVPVTVVVGSTVFDLGTVSVDPDGRFDVSLTLPADVPHGYAELHLDRPRGRRRDRVPGRAPRRHHARRAARRRWVRVRQPGGCARPVHRDAGRHRGGRRPAHPRRPQADVLTPARRLHGPSYPQAALTARKFTCRCTFAGGSDEYARLANCARPCGGDAPAPPPTRGWPMTL